MAFVSYLKSDFVQVRASHPTSLVIRYSNSSNFDGVIYEAGSPPPVFYLRIQAMFHVEQNDQEGQDLELNNGSIKSMVQALREKRLLETDYLPMYMHKKIQKVLMNESIFINNDYWKQGDGYVTSPVKKYNLKMATVYLTKYNSILRNTI